MLCFTFHCAKSWQFSILKHTSGFCISIREAKRNKTKENLRYQKLQTTQFPVSNFLRFIVFHKRHQQQVEERKEFCFWLINFCFIYFHFQCESAARVEQKSKVKRTSFEVFTFVEVMLWHWRRWIESNERKVRTWQSFWIWTKHFDSFWSAD